MILHFCNRGYSEAGPKEGPDESYRCFVYLTGASKAGLKDVPDEKMWSGGDET